MTTRPEIWGKELGTTMLGKVSWERTTRTGKCGQDRRRWLSGSKAGREREDMTARKRHKDRTAGSGQPGRDGVVGQPWQCSTVGIGHLRHDSRHKNGTGQSLDRLARQVSLDRTAWTGRPGQDSLNMAARKIQNGLGARELAHGSWGQDSRARIARTGKPGQNSQNVTARTRHLGQDGLTGEPGQDRIWQQRQDG
jgi:hypothetical protein